MNTRSDIPFRPHVSGRSRVVSILKLVLPLAALALLSSIFLLASPVDPERAIRTAEIDVEERARDPRLTQARFAGVTRDGSALLIETETARTDPLGTLRFQVTGLSLHIDNPDGGTLRAYAGSGIIDRGAGRFDMAGPVMLDVSPGYRLEGEQVSGLLDQTLVESDRPVRGTAPAGEIEAGNLRLERGPPPDGGNRLVFGGGVRLIYQPHP
ncbi:MAG: hypothetical protein ACXIVG_14830 [Pararhodobacter sp.]